MKLSMEKLNSYRKNKACLEEVTVQIMDELKGRNFSFSKKISDRKGNFEPAKLDRMIGDMLSIWEQTYRDYAGSQGGATDPSLDGYLKERREFYRSYLWAAMFSLFFAEDKERAATYASLAKGAVELSDDWCVMEKAAEGEVRKVNEPLWGFDAYAPFRLYQSLAPDFLTYPNQLPIDHTDQFTNEGNKKRFHIIKKSPTPAMNGSADPAAEPESDSESYDDEDAYYHGDPDLINEWTDAGNAVASEAEPEGVAMFAAKYSDAYIEACRSFVSSYRNASPCLMRDFSREIGEIVDMYLIASDTTVLTDIDDCLRVYGQLYDRPLQMAKKYARGIILRQM